jgi:hypothetical protein
LGIFCWIAASSLLGLFGMGFFESSVVTNGMVCLFFGGGMFAALEFFIRQNKYYRAGIDDALLYMALSMVITGMSLLFSSLFKENAVLYCLLALPFLLTAAIRYTDTVVSALAFACLVAIVFLLFKESSLLSELIPLTCMLLAAGIYSVIRRNKERKELRFWADCLQVAEAACLILFYASGNYFVVEDVGEMLFPGFHMPFSFIFWIFTALTPLGYVYFGLKIHDRLLLRIGLLMIALSVLTFKYYFSVSHHEVTLTVAGAILLLVAYYAIRYLKNNSGKFTYQADRSDDNPGFQDTEALVIAQTASGSVVPEKDFGFGGGKFGGGGAGGNY